MSFKSFGVMLVKTRASSHNEITRSRLGSHGVLGCLLALDRQRQVNL